MAETASTLEAILRRFSRLRIDRSKGPAPHKPLLLLVLLDLAEKGLLTSPALSLTPEISFRFNCYWTIVAHRRHQAPDVRYPFYHLKSDGFWRAFDLDGTEANDVRQAREARVEAGFLHLAGDEKSRNEARRILISTYFEPAEQVALLTMLGLPVCLETAGSVEGEQREEAVSRGRDVRFRLDVASAYDFTCALTGYRVTTIGPGSIVDAAHIHTFSKSRNDDPRNGLALSKNAHWLFDNGLWTLGDDYRVQVAADCFSEECPNQRPLATYQGHTIRLPAAHSAWPDVRHLTWHRTHVFQGRAD